MLYSAREEPIMTAKVMGPARSPMALEIPRPFSIKADAHWLTACSLAPAQSMRITMIQKVPRERRDLTESPSPRSSFREIMGARQNAKKFAKGTTAHKKARICQ